LWVEQASRLLVVRLLVLGTGQFNLALGLGVALPGIGGTGKGNNYFYLYSLLISKTFLGASHL